MSEGVYCRFNRTTFSLREVNCGWKRIEGKNPICDHEENRGKLCYLCLPAHQLQKYEESRVQAGEVVGDFV